MFSDNAGLIEEQYRRWQADPEAVEPTWRAFFAGMQFAGSSGAAGPVPTATSADLRVQTGVVRLINWYRQAGHLEARIDPLAPAPPPPCSLLALENFGLSAADLDRVVDGSMVFGVSGPIRLAELIDRLRETYCGSIGVEYMHIDSLDVRLWLAKRMEPVRNRYELPLRQKYRILLLLHEAELFEKFLHTKYVGQKRFSLEGGETLIPILDTLIEHGPDLGVREYVIGMAHRGRLNVLANILRKPFEQIFNEFEDNVLPQSTFDGDGDVKYHLGFSADVETAQGQTVHLSLTPNPSHLEMVNPVVLGRVRCKQRLHGDTDRTAGVPVLIHGDAAFAGQGIIMETLNLMNLAGYRTGGTIHVVVNNQIGFTTNPRDARSTQYCTDIAKFVQVPIFHVNAEDPEACVAVARLALEFRQTFKRDVVIDLVCYRKWGHNEGDNPGFTQPLQSKAIEAKKPISRVYAARLAGQAAREGVTANVAEAIELAFEQKLKEALAVTETVTDDYRRRLESAHLAIRNGVAGEAVRRRGMEGYGGRWQGLSHVYTHDPVPTGVSEDVLDRIADALATVPEGFTPHPNLPKVLHARRDNVRSRKYVDWATAEALAFGSLVLEGIHVRLSGQDSRRGTFSQRHAVLVDYNTGAEYYPLAHLDPNQAPFDVYDSSLSEAAILGFEFGYSLDDPYALVMWEAQFGDFANGAQVIIDQFITSCESKWRRASGLVLLLPHGYEGQGPEHSSARLERFLQMCAEDNIQVVYPTTPAQYFHLLRRQVKRRFRKPLVVMTPKSLLRFSESKPWEHQAASPLRELTTGHFREVLDDLRADPGQVTRVLLCSGKVYYELAAYRDRQQLRHVAVLRLEQFYPWPAEQLNTLLARYRHCREWVWVQEESQNMGGWSFVEPRLRALGFPFEYVGRDASASPATGSYSVHKLEQELVIEGAFAERLPVSIGPGYVGWVRCVGSGPSAPAAAGSAPLRHEPLAAADGPNAPAASPPLTGTPHEPAPNVDTGHA